MELKSRRPLKSPCLTEFTVLNGDEEAATAIMLSAILPFCSTLASSWPTKAEWRLVGNAVNSLDFILLSSAFLTYLGDPSLYFVDQLRQSLVS